MTYDPFDDLDDPRPDHERAADAALGTAVAHAARELLAEGNRPAPCHRLRLDGAGGLLAYFGRNRRALFEGTAADVARLRMGGAPNA